MPTSARPARRDSRGRAQPDPGLDFTCENEALRALGLSVESITTESDAEVADADVLLPMGRGASRELIFVFDHGRMIASIGVGADLIDADIDVGAATGRGILVSNMGDLFVD